jgi:hypothetical protein
MTQTSASRPIAELLDSVRSKNAGPFTVSVDLFFRDQSGFDEVVEGDILNVDVVAALYGVQPKDVLIVKFPAALAIKVSIPRLVSGGAPGDRDVAGGQQYAPILSVRI